MGEAHRLPLRDQLRGALDHFAEPGGMIAGKLRQIFADHMIGQQRAPALVWPLMMEMLEMAEADMACAPAASAPRPARAFRACTCLVGGDDRQRPRGGNAQRRHRFAAEIFADGGAHHRAAIAEARIRRLAGAFELDVPQFALARFAPAPISSARPSPNCPAQAPN